MHFDQLLHFKKVAELGSFTAASIALNITQPAISRSIRLLEVDLHKTLFHRNGRGITLTEDGQAILHIARQIFALIDTAKEVFDTDTRKIVGHISVGLPPSLGRLITAPLFQAFKVQFPKSKISISEALSRSLIERVAANDLHIALAFDPPNNAHINAQQLATQSLHLIARRSEAHAHGPTIAFGEVLGSAMLLPSKANPIRLICEQQAAKLDKKLTIDSEIDGIESILRLVRDGYGKTIGLPSLIEDHLFSRDLAAIKIVEPEIPCAIALITPAHGQRNILEEKTKHILANIVAQTIASS